MDEFVMPSWNYNHAFGSNVDEEIHLLPQSTMLALGYLRNKRARVWKTKKSWLACFEGGHREGKSFSATVFGACLDSTFEGDLNHRVIHGHQKFIDAVKEFDKDRIYGGVIVADEAGVVGNFSSAEWQTEWMAAINSVLQMFGYLHPIVLFIAPDKSFIDSKIRRMFHTLHRVSRPNNEYVKVKPYNMRWNQFKKKWDEVSPVIRIGNTKIKMKHLILRHYPQELGERYQALEQSRKPDMLANLGQRITASHIQEAKKGYDVKGMVEIVFKNYTEYESKRSKPENVILEAALIQIGLGVPMNYAKYIKDKVEKRFKIEKPELPT